MKTLALAAVATAIACTPAQEAEAGKILADVVSGIEHGQTVEQIEQQVAVDAGFSGVVNTIVVTLVVDAIDEAIALGFIPANLIPTAQALETSEADKLVKAGAHVPHALLSIHRAAF